eukprot:scaffold1208_cov231-Pinguiococcus_pyrenoidosus.AAC.5
MQQIPMLHHLFLERLELLRSQRLAPLGTSQGQGTAQGQRPSQLRRNGLGQSGGQGVRHRLVSRAPIYLYGQGLRGVRDEGDFHLLHAARARELRLRFRRQANEEQLVAAVPGSPDAEIVQRCLIGRLGGELDANVGHDEQGLDVQATKQRRQDGAQGDFLDVATCAKVAQSTALGPL